MKWQIELSATASKELAKLDSQISKRIVKYLDERIATAKDPRRFGEGLVENLTGLWRYRVGDYRIVAEIHDGRFVVLVIRVGHRSKVYGGH